MVSQLVLSLFLVGESHYIPHDVSISVDLDKQFKYSVPLVSCKSVAVSNVPQSFQYGYLFH